MCDQQEMTLDEWMGKLPSIHRASKELAAIREDLEALAVAAKDLVANYTGDNIIKTKKALALPVVAALLKEKNDE